MAFNGCVFVAASEHYEVNRLGFVVEFVMFRHVADFLHTFLVDTDMRPVNVGGSEIFALILVLELMVQLFYQCLAVCDDLVVRLGQIANHIVKHDCGSCLF